MPRTIAAVALVLVPACARDSSVTAPPSPSISMSVNGFVHDTARRPGQARVEVVDGPQAGAVTTSDDAGGYSFAVTFTASLTLRASKDGYVPATSRVNGVAGISRWGQTLVLASPSPSVDLTGNWVVTLAADNVCTNLPAIARTRSYPAAVVRTPFVETTFQGTVSVPIFMDTGTSDYSFWAAVFADFARFSFPISVDEVNGLVEQVGPDSYMNISGAADAVVSGSSIDVPFAGRFEFCGADSGTRFFKCSVPLEVCSSKQHRLTLTRQ